MQKLSEGVGVKPVKVSRTIAAHWNVFDAKVLQPVFAGGKQKQEMRRAYYAGAHTLFMLMATAAKSGNEKDSIALIGDLQAEILQFYDAVARGEM